MIDIDDKIKWLHRNGILAACMRIGGRYYAGWLAHGGRKFDSSGYSTKDAHGKIFDRVKRKLESRCDL